MFRSLGSSNKKGLAGLLLILALAASGFGQASAGPIEPGMIQVASRPQALAPAR